MATKTQQFTSTSSPLPKQFTTSHTSHNPSALQFNHLIKPHIISQSPPLSSTSSSMSISSTYPYAPPVDNPAPLNPNSPSLLKRLTNRLQLAYYRYEVTYGIYVMTPGEKFVANTFLLVFISLLVYGLFLYFPPLLYQKLSRLAWILTGAGMDGVKERVSAELKFVNGSGVGSGLGAAPGPGPGPWNSGGSISISPTATNQPLPHA
ncbi:hypothetical protein RJZ56_000071 [Blastomyces dermatitidis]|uniref:Serine palmitoyltransferase n=2 Tax=Ajellomyces dermatitidis TaxID=5039 RepID=F2TDJ7_AJEDA|nr:uncharacterized protein BDCG_01256 [Blastomyces dermatitidis ER-3]XP_045279501.1 hypothetical protein, variant [Blastomyces dermatitidis ER-3]EGE81310.1 hypothetical protein BDDG_04251 [Blastomyces dermatitidis ATCC 18188]EQL36965.1 hypothetical protein BDFG_01596 [Blastomyces dermatitidis ATCC 26199]EEQ84451.1 hypothetical protein BDCG_01256 [Blastomyces dermatitidis ER-3]EQL36966.1 hypothetical protein, variant 1 [Blastomyces dermatitidis ATCC 26199]EQL36967.1 hypothetical protein, varia